MGSAKKVGKITRKAAESFEKDGKSFVRFFPVDGGSVDVEVFGPREFEAEQGITFIEFCEQIDEVE